jgi:2-amino-4-hydroxy-6-hydroxymethyldihydropteridine diphosphokinase
MMMHQAFVALGSNLQNPVQQLHHAFAEIAALPDTQLIKQSSLYQTAPVDCPALGAEKVPDFINAVVEIQTALTPEALLQALHGIEDKAGRERPYINAPRVLDCDLLLYEDYMIDSKQLTLPHPRMHTRGFVLLPLFEIAPQLSMPIHGKIAELIHETLSKDIQKLD